MRSKLVQISSSKRSPRELVTSSSLKFSSSQGLHLRVKQVILEAPGRWQTRLVCICSLSPLEKFPHTFDVPFRSDVPSLEWVSDLALHCVPLPYMSQSTSFRVFLFLLPFPLLSHVLGFHGRMSVVSCEMQSRGQWFSRCGPQVRSTHLDLFKHKDSQPHHLDSTGLREVGQGIRMFNKLTGDPSTQLGIHFY